MIPQCAPSARSAALGAPLRRGSRRSLRCFAAGRQRSGSRAPPPPPRAPASPESPTQRIETAFEECFGTLKVQRALDSFTRIMRDETFAKDWPELGRQEAFSFVEGLTAKPFHDVDASAGERGFAWAAALEKQHGVIAAELAAATAPDAAEKLARSGSRVWSAAARADAAGYGPEWRTLVLQDRGRWDETNAALFPATVKAVRDARVPSVECFFARQAPGSGIKPHSDGSNFIMTAHLGLDVPEGKCWLKVGEQTRGWANGKMLVFDTSFIHETFNEGNQDRYVLLMRFWHPELTQLERIAIQFLFDAADDDSKIGLKDAERAAHKKLRALMG